MSNRIASSKSAQTRLRIIDAAARIFREVGFAAASLRDIAEMADMQAGSLYYHFGSKEELAEAVMMAGVDGSFDAVQKAVSELPDDVSPLDKIEAAFAAHLSFLLGQSDYSVAMLRMLHQTSPALRERTLMRQRAFGNFFRDVLKVASDQDLIKPGMDLSALRMLLFGAMNWTPEWYVESGLSARELAGQLRRLIER